MTRLTLNIQRDIDLAVLLPLLNRLQITYEGLPETARSAAKPNKIWLGGFIVIK